MSGEQADFRWFMAWNCAGIETFTPRAVAFFENYCRENTPCPLEDEDAGTSERMRRFTEPLGDDGAYTAKAMAAAKAAGLIDEQDQ